MHNTFKSLKQKFADYVPDLELTCGAVVVIVLSCALSVITFYSNISESFFSLDSSAVSSGHVYKLFSYWLYHKNATSFCLSAVVMLYLCSGLEKGVGTVRFLYQLLLLSSVGGLLHALLELLLFSPSNRSSVSGLIPLVLSVMGMVTINSMMRRSHLLGVNVPTASLPWIFLIFVTLLIPNTVFLCNVLAIVTGITYGMGWFSLLEMSESRASILDKKFPFRLLKMIPSVQFIPASSEERDKPLDLTDCPPGSYPVQAYVPVNPATGQAVGTQANSLDGWPHAAFPQQNYTFPSAFTVNSGVNEHGHGHGHNHGQCHSHGHHLGHHHGHSHQQFPAQHANNPWMPAFPYAQTQFRPPVNMTGQPYIKLPQPGVPFTPQTSQSESLSQSPGFPSTSPGTSVSLSA